MNKTSEFYIDETITYLKTTRNKGNHTGNSYVGKIINDCLILLIKAKELQSITQELLDEQKTDT